MGEIQVALVAIALVLSAVFLPMAFFGGSTGVIYRQFSLTIVSAMVLSVFVALVFSPALTATVLRQRSASGTPRAGWLDAAHGDGESPCSRASNWFNRGFERLSTRYREIIVRVIERKWLALGIYALVCLALVIMFLRLPTGFLPTEDQGAAQVAVPPAAGGNREPHGGGPGGSRKVFYPARSQERRDLVHGRRRRRWRWRQPPQNTGQGRIK